ncbi:MAG: hypothetical protein HRT69_10495 [Flavobacteriaceae bacterium]|nr:hypothetical protein [Flavobacteriaceae bacterium]
MLSFLAMTLQLLSAKFILELPLEKINSFKNKLNTVEYDSEFWNSFYKQHPSFLID